MYTSGKIESHYFFVESPDFFFHVRRQDKTMFYLESYTVLFY